MYIPVEELAEENGIELTHLATISVHQVEDGGPIAFLIMADDEGVWVDVPPAMAAQIPMALTMMKNTAGG